MSASSGRTSALIVGFLLSIAGGIGCGGKSVAVIPKSQCPVAILTGSVKDSLTGLAIPGANVLLETPSPLGASPVLDFSPSVIGQTDTKGSFSICSAQAVTSAILVIDALDRVGNAYPPTIVALSPRLDFGSILLGSCNAICGFPGQAQTAAPFDISGTITTSPASEAGSIMAQTAINALDGAKGIWKIALPGLLTGQQNTFQSVAMTCPAAADQCTSYNYTLPSQAPVVIDGGVYKQQVALPTYSITAALSGQSTCTEPFLSTSFQVDLAHPLTALAGSHLTAATLSFSGCH